MVAAHRAGRSLRQVAKDFGEAKSTVQRWVAFAEGMRLDRVDFHDKKSGPKKPKNKSSAKLEKRVLMLPKRWQRDDAKPPQGKMIYLRRTDGSGRVRFLEREFVVSEHWINRLVRVEVDLDEGKLHFFALRRSEWKSQRLLKTIKFSLSKKTTSD